jgi:hypothetical protein
MRKMRIAPGDRVRFANDGCVRTGRVEEVGETRVVVRSGVTRFHVRADQLVPLNGAAGMEGGEAHVGAPD